MLPVITYVMLPWLGTVGGSPKGVASDNNVKLVKVYMPATITVATINFGIASQTTGRKYGVGLYDLDGNLVLDSGPVTASGSGIHQTHSISITPVVIGAGLYWMAYTCTSSADSFEPLTTPSIVCNLICNGTSIVAHATNPSVGGQLPSTTGTIVLDGAPGSNIGALIKLES